MPGQENKKKTPLPSKVTFFTAQSENFSIGKQRKSHKNSSPRDLCNYLKQVDLDHAYDKRSSIYFRFHTFHRRQIHDDYYDHR